MDAFLDDPSAADSGLTARWLVQPNRTRRLILATLRRHIAAVERPYRGEPPAEPSRSKSWLNYGGETWHRNLTAGLSLLTAKRWGSDFTVRSTSVLLALRAYHIDHGRLPQHLDALVPDYLDAVPRDPWDGKPLRYSAARRQIWAVGDDLVDDGGSEEERDHALSGEKDPTLRWGEWSER